VVIATIFLTIIGGTVGFMLGERHRDDDGGGPQETTTTQTAAEPPSTTPSGQSCPPEAIKLAATDLRQVFKIITTNGTTVWICQDSAGSLYYQGKTRSEDGQLVQGRNGLFLDDVERVGDDDYRAAATNGNTFEINRSELVVHYANGDPDQVYTVKTVE
jgi:hypothetical protein